jgi:hypothetical protein
MIEIVTHLDLVLVTMMSKLNCQTRIFTIISSVLTMRPQWFLRKCRTFVASLSMNLETNLLPILNTDGNAEISNVNVEISEKNWVILGFFRAKITVFYNILRY